LSTDEQLVHTSAAQHSQLVPPQHAPGTQSLQQSPVQPSHPDLLAVTLLSSEQQAAPSEPAPSEQHAVDWQQPDFDEPLLNAPE